MKAVLISIRPQWCELIASGKKTIEVRKTRPKLETPFKCYIYQTRPKKSLIDIIYDGQELYGETYHGKTAFITTYKDVSAGSRTYGKWGKVIGEFVCDNLFYWVKMGYMNSGVKPAYHFGANIAMTCLTYDELEKYAKGRPIFGWHISDLVIYDKPKELSEFHRPCTPACNYSAECGGTNATVCLFGISRAPQSWYYVEELE